jgi:hypothetical protein
LSCAPRRFPWAFAGAMMRATKAFLKQYHDFDDLGGKPNETTNILIDLRFDFYWHGPERFLGDGG